MAVPSPLSPAKRRSAKEAADLLRSEIGSDVTRPVKFRDEITVSVKPASIEAALKHCKSKLDFNSLVDLCSVDHAGESLRFEVIYHLYSFKHACHLRIKTRIPEDEPSVPTASRIWPTADWHEREVYDMMGIQFAGHPDLRRILMWEGYPYFPLRKEFPLAGKESDAPDIAFTDAAPLEGGPFVTTPTSGGTADREPRSRGE